jgi:hypothetical protein
MNDDLLLPTPPPPPLPLPPLLLLLLLLLPLPPLNDISCITSIMCSKVPAPPPPKDKC